MTETQTSQRMDFHFGSMTCALCFGQYLGRKERYIDEPILDGDTVLIPKGRHKFHVDCWRELLGYLTEEMNENP